MRLLVTALLLFCSPCFAQENPVGQWKLTEMIYHGERVPPLNPKLNLFLTFFNNGTDRLFWDRAGESGFCERFAHYEILNNKLHEIVFSVNPLNSPDCAQDPDMQVGRETLNVIEINNNEILLHLQLADEELIYVFTEVL
ncbi:MAG: hypothetical protein JSU04_08655 [Bdellovibrionales bacterium]|nr:hypothetical protein [Bdellovibrionales bacterium]